jgi:hypothetical protein
MDKQSTSKFLKQVKQALNLFVLDENFKLYKKETLDDSIDVGTEERFVKQLIHKDMDLNYTFGSPSKKRDPETDSFVE